MSYVHSRCIVAILLVPGTFLHAEKPPVQPALPVIKAVAPLAPAPLQGKKLVFSNDSTWRMSVNYTRPDNAEVHEDVFPGHKSGEMISKDGRYVYAAHKEKEQVNMGAVPAGTEFFSVTEAMIQAQQPKPAPTPPAPPAQTPPATPAKK